LGDTLLATHIYQANRQGGLAASPPSKRLLADCAPTPRAARILAPELKRSRDLSATRKRAAHLPSDATLKLLDPLAARSVRGDRATAVQTFLCRHQRRLSSSNRRPSTRPHKARPPAQQDALAELIANLRRASTGLDRLVSELRDNPAALLFSAPPAPLPETGMKTQPEAAASKKRTTP
jgi:hypothetical protein